MAKYALLLGHNPALKTLLQQEEKEKQEQQEQLRVKRKAQAEALLRSLEAAAQAFPDMRVGQLLSNAIHGKADLFYVENDHLQHLVDEYLKNIS